MQCYFMSNFFFTECHISTHLLYFGVNENNVDTLISVLLVSKCHCMETSFSGGIPPLALEY